MSELIKWEYVTVPLLVHATKQILDQWGEQGYELGVSAGRPDGRAAHCVHEAAYMSVSGGQERSDSGSVSVGQGGANWGVSPEGRSEATRGVSP